MRTVILDTNVLLDRPFENVINSFEPCKIVIPITVLNELDTFKNNLNPSLKENSRAASRFIDKLRNIGKLHEGVILDSGHVIKIELNCNDVKLPINLEMSSTDFKLLQICQSLKNRGEDVTLCTQDTNERIIADVLGIKAIDYGDFVEEIYTGWTTIEVFGEMIDQFCYSSKPYMDFDYENLFENEYIILKDIVNPKHTALGRYSDGKLWIVPGAGYKPYGIRALNVQQTFLIDLLINPNINLVTAIGKAGSGKTLLTIASGLEQTEGLGSTSTYKKMFVTRSTIPVGKDIGYLPGNESQKINPWLGAFYDNMELLVSKHATTKSGKAIDPSEAVKMVMDLNKIETKPITHVRGRSLVNRFFIIEEAQNLTSHEIKTLISRAGSGTKVILVGDIDQIDNHRLSRNNNGLVNLVKAFKGQPIYGHISLEKIERSTLADLATKLL